MLPPPHVENDFIESLSTNLQTGACTQEELRELISLAIEAKRPRLASKLFAFLENPPENDPELAKAQRALSLFFVQNKDMQEEEREISWADIDWQQIALFWQQLQQSPQGRRMRNRHMPRQQYGMRAWRKR